MRGILIIITVTLELYIFLTHLHLSVQWGLYFIGISWCCVFCVLLSYDKVVGICLFSGAVFPDSQTCQSKALIEFHHYSQTCRLLSVCLSIFYSKMTFFVCHEFNIMRFCREGNTEHQPNPLQSFLLSLRRLSLFCLMLFVLLVRQCHTLS